MRSSSLLLSGFVFVRLSVSGAEKPAVDKTAYSRANPTPGAVLREMTTDRPDVTESPFTIDAGHAQLEMEGVSVTRDQQAGVRTTEVAVGSFNFRLGLRRDFEVAFFFEPYLRHTERAGTGPTTSTHGIGDTTLRAKLNLWGNDGGAAAFGVMVEVELPTAARGLGRNQAEWTAAVPLAFELGRGWDAGAMTSVSAVHDGSGYRAVWLNTLTLGHNLVEGIGAYFEVTSQAGDGGHACTFDTGFAWHLHRNLRLDTGLSLGISRSAPDVNWFVGVSRRF